MTHFTHTNKLSRKRSFFTSFNTTMPQISVKKLVRHRNMQKLVNRQGALALLMIHLPNALTHLTQSKVPTVKRTLGHEHLNLASKYPFFLVEKKKKPSKHQEMPKPWHHQSHEQDPSMWRSSSCRPPGMWMIYSLHGPIHQEKPCLGDGKGDIGCTRCGLDSIFFAHGKHSTMRSKNQKKKRFWSSKDSTKNHGIFRTHTPPHGRFFLARPGTCRQCSHLGHQAQCRCWPDNPSHSLFRECLEPPNFCWLVGLCWIECIEILPILS